MIIDNRLLNVQNIVKNAHHNFPVSKILPFSFYVQPTVQNLKSF